MKRIKINLSEGKANINETMSAFEALLLTFYFFQIIRENPGSI